MEIALLLGVPLAGAALLALFGQRAWAPEANALMSLATLAGAAALTARVIAGGPFSAFEEQVFVDPFNVFLVALTSFVAFTTSLFSRPYM
ncbi:MAG TPA: hydrogenase 4 subunit F, partial [Burkholderiales bacterium]|nr:hydrogenase 4 subunit F [Burkholderiales bacterium]